MSQAAHAERTVAVISVTDAGRTYSLDEAARLCGLHPEMVRHYCQIGLLGATYTSIENDAGFDDDAVYWLRRIERARREHALDRATLPLLCDLWRRIEQLEAEVRLLRC